MKLKVMTYLGEKITIPEGSLVTITDISRSSTEVEVQWSGNTALIPLMIKGMRTLGAKKPESDKWFGGRRIRKLHVGSQRDEAVAIELVTGKKDPFYKFWHPKVNINGKDEFGLTPFLQACAYGSFDTIEKFIRDGTSNLSQTDYFGRNALHLLCLSWIPDTFRRRLEAMGYLVKSGVPSSTLCMRGMRPEDYVRAMADSGGDQFADQMVAVLYGTPALSLSPMPSTMPQMPTHVELQVAHPHQTLNGANTQQWVKDE